MRIPPLAVAALALAAQAAVAQQFAFASESQPGDQARWSDATEASSMVPPAAGTLGWFCRPTDVFLEGGGPTGVELGQLVLADASSLLPDDLRRAMRNDERPDREAAVAITAPAPAIWWRTAEPATIRPVSVGIGPGSDRVEPSERSLGGIPQALLALLLLRAFLALRPGREAA